MRVSGHVAALEARTAGYKPLVPYPGKTDRPWPAECMECHRTRRPRLSEIRRGLRCHHYQSQSAHYGRRAGSKQPKADTIADMLRHDIAAGIYRINDRIPSAEDAAKKHRTSPVTARKAYRRLQDQGLVEVRRGVGTFVIQDMEGTRT